MSIESATTEREREKEGSETKAEILGKEAISEKEEEKKGKK